MGKQVQTLVVADEESKSNRAMARLVHAFPDGQTFLIPNNADDLARKLRDFAAIGNLVFELHGIPGSMATKGGFVSVDDLARLLKDTKLKVSDAIIYEGCSIATFPSMIVSLMNTLNAPKTIGYDVYHAWGGGKGGEGIPIKVEKGLSVSELDNKLKDIKPYLLPGQPDAATMVKNPKTYTLYVEWFTRDIGGTVFPRSDSERRLAIPRGKLVPTSFASDRLSSTSQGDLDVPAGDMHIVTITRSSPTPAPAPRK
jgi:hypothetical protein